VRVTVLNVYFFGNIDFLSTRVAENYFKMYKFNEFSEENRDQWIGHWKGSRHITMADFFANVRLFKLRLHITTILNDNCTLFPNQTLYF